jgi:hypothetical protein
MRLSLFATLIVILGPIVLSADEKPIKAPDTKYSLSELLTEPFGTVVTVQGLVVDGRNRASSGPNVLIQRIDGRATQEEIQIPLNADFDDPGIAKLAYGSTYEFKGYETGRFVGLPKGVPPPENGGAYTGFHFMHLFNIFAVKKIDRIHWSPADFVDREALIEGKAVSENKKACIAGKDWRLIVNDEAAWSKGYEGKTVEGLGLIRKSETAKTYLLEKGSVRLVKLEDGMKVALRGTAYSMNGHWWFDYRGTDLYVENMKDLPNWDFNLHGKSMVIEGVLDEAILPDIGQITLKKDRDKKKYFIVRKPTWKPIDALLAPERDGR